MSRWLVLALVSSATLSVGCGSSVRAGLANAPRLGGTSTADNRVTDVVSNGDDACGLYSEAGVLRNRIPACPHATAVHNVGVSVGRAASDGASNGGLVEPWLNHFYVGWPCSPRTSAGEMTLWSASQPTVATCSVP